MGFRKINFLTFIILLFLISNFSFGEKYIPKNNEERLILENLKNKKIVFGLHHHKLHSTRSKHNNMSVNDIFIDLFNNYLDLNVTFKEGSFSTLFTDFEIDNIQGISLINDHEKRREILSFSDSIFNDIIYIGSSKKYLYSIDSLEGEKIYVASRVLYKIYLEKILFNNNINAEVIEVEDISKYKDEFILTNIPIIYDFFSSLKVSNSSNSGIGISKELDELLPIINSALNYKYKELINNQIKYVEKDLALDNFYSSLTEDEKIYLKNLKDLNVYYEYGAYSELYYFSEVNERFQGIVPKIFHKIKDSINIDIKNSIGSLEDIGDSGKIYSLSRTKDRNENLIFSNNFYDIPAYMVILKGLNLNDNVSVGVVINSLEEEIIRNYSLYETLKIYPTYISLIEALNNDEIQKILTTDIRLIDTKKYDISFFENIPISFAFNQKDLLLKNIIDKAIAKLISLDLVVSNSIVEKSNEELLLLSDANSKKRNLTFFSLGLLFLLSFSCVRIIIDKRYKSKLLKDPLSKLPNRIVFNEFCKNKVDYSKGYAVIIDFDNFKDINDTYGHEVGDKVISEFSSYLRNHFDYKTIFRISGDEFYGIIDKNLDEIINIMKDYTKFCPLMKKYQTSFSIGIYKKIFDSCIKTDFKYADMAMFEAKKTNGFSYKVADVEFIEVKEKEEQILAILNGNLDEIYPVFQPKINLNTNIVIGVEALARCQSKEFGMIYPLEFIGIAETYNIVHRIDFKIAEESIKLIKEKIYNRNLHKDFRISFNISVNTFKRKDLVETIENLLTKYEVSGKYIEIEVTESVLVTDMKDIIDKLNKLIKLGIQISLDDFTAGHSTAGLLPLLPLSIVKFDKSLLDSINQSEERAKIVYLSLISLVRELNIKIVAEGIETIEEFEFIRDSGVDYGQGYLIGRPVPYEDLTTL